MISSYLYPDRTSSDYQHDLLHPGKYPVHAQATVARDQVGSRLSRSAAVNFLPEGVGFVSKVKIFSLNFGSNAVKGVFLFTPYNAFKC